MALPQGLFLFGQEEKVVGMLFFDACHSGFGGGIIPFDDPFQSDRQIGDDRNHEIAVTIEAAFEEERGIDDGGKIAGLFSFVEPVFADGKDVLIAAAENSPSNCYISSMSVDGKSWTKNYLTHQQLSSGADIDFIMSAEPNTSRGTADNDKPYSFSNER